MFGSMKVGAVVKISVSRKTTNSAKIRLKMKNERLSECRSRSVWNAKRSIPTDKADDGDQRDQHRGRDRNPQPGDEHVHAVERHAHQRGLREIPDLHHLEDERKRNSQHRLVAGVGHARPQHLQKDVGAQHAAQGLGRSPLTSLACHHSYRRNGV